ncbi:uncharacterized protein [Anoplolepis gracilipes]|uniref:uncharacterized protein n=1 Tax=Anoplolepis gracilipes TaxID=354296 RepID=UPI003B9EC8B0
MSRISRKKELLQKINNISEECSEIDECLQSESEDELNDSFESDHELDSDYENYSSSTNEEEDNLNASRGRKRMRLLTDSEDDSEESNERQNIEIAIDGTVWKKIETSSSPGRLPLHTIFKDVSGPTGHAKRNIMMGKCI